VQAIAVHWRTKDQGYSGAADWDVIAQVAAAVKVPVIGNGDIAGAHDAERRMKTGVRGLMLGRAAMSAPWIFRETKAYLANGEIVDPPTLEERWKLILRHCLLHVREWGVEEPAVHSMRARLMAYSKSMPEAKRLREKFSQVSTIADVESIAADNILNSATVGEAASFPHRREANSFAYRQ
jgi:tRNA-dihydrouridine synthase B